MIEITREQAILLIQLMKDHIIETFSRGGKDFLEVYPQYGELWDFLNSKVGKHEPVKLESPYETRFETIPGKEGLWARFYKNGELYDPFIELTNIQSNWVSVEVKTV